MIAQKRNSILIFDTNIFLTGIDFSLIPSQIYSTSQVIEELEVVKYAEKNENILNKILAARETGKLIIKTPKDIFFNLVLEKSKKSGDFKSLSKTDIGVIALALELKETEMKPVVVYTNDYSIENLCSHFNLDFKPIFKPGIKKKRFFELFCPSCKKIYSTDVNYDECVVCGAKLKRRFLGSNKKVGNIN